MKSLFRVLAVVIFLSFPTFAQDKVKMSGGLVNAEIELNPISAIENIQGFYVEVDGRIFSKSNFRLGGVFNYQRNGISQDDPVDTYMAGLQFSYRAGPVEPFAGVLFGVNTTYSNDKTFARKYRVGLDVPFHKESNFFVRPFFIEWERTEGLFSPATRKYGAGAGLRF